MSQELEPRVLDKMSGRVDEVERQMHTHELEQLRQELSLVAVTESVKAVDKAVDALVGSVETTKKEFREEIDKLRYYILASVIAIVLSNFVPVEALNAVVTAFIKAL